MDYVDFDSLAQKLAPTLQVLENKRKELLRKGRSEGLIYAAIFLVVGVIAWHSCKYPWLIFVV